MYCHVDNRLRTEHYSRLQVEFLAKLIRYLGLNNLVYLTHTKRIGEISHYKFEKRVHYVVAGVCFLFIYFQYGLIVHKILTLTVEPSLRHPHSAFWQITFLALWSWSTHSILQFLVQKHKLIKPLNELLRILDEVEKHLGCRNFVQSRLFWLLRTRDLFALLTIGLYFKVTSFKELLPNSLNIILYELAFNSAILYLQVIAHLYCNLNEFVACKCVLSLEQRAYLRRSMKFLNELAISTQRQHCNLFYVVEDLRKWLICRVFMACIILVQALRCYYFRSHATALERLTMIAGYLPLYISLILEIYIAMELNSLRERESQKLKKNLRKLATYLWYTCSMQDPYRSAVRAVHQQINFDLINGRWLLNKVKYRPDFWIFLRLSTIFLVAYLLYTQNDYTDRATETLDKPCNLTCLWKYNCLTLDHQQISKLIS